MKIYSILLRDIHVHVFQISDVLASQTECIPASCWIFPGVLHTVFSISMWDYFGFSSFLWLSKNIPVGELGAPKDWELMMIGCSKFLRCEWMSRFVWWLALYWQPVQSTVHSCLSLSVLRITMTLARIKWLLKVNDLCSTCMVVQWVALLSQSSRVWSRSRVTVCLDFCIFPMSVWVSCGLSGCISCFRNILVGGKTVRKCP